MNEDKQWGICQLMGHKVFAGLVSQEEKFGAVLTRVDIPEVDGIPAHTEYFNAQNALYCYTPSDEETVKAVIRRETPVSIEPWTLKSYYLPEVVEDNGWDEQMTEIELDSADDSPELYDNDLPF